MKLKVRFRKLFKDMNDMEIGDIEKRDEKICRGCRSKAVAEEDDTTLLLTCHGNPFIEVVEHIQDTEIARCPCEKCLVKAMCGEPCPDFDLYGEMSHGKISVEYYFNQLAEWKEDDDKSM